MHFDLERDADGAPILGPDGRMKLVVVPDPPQDDPWPDQVCGICGETVSVFGSARAKGCDAVCFRCGGDFYLARAPISVKRGGEHVVMLAHLVRLLWKESHAARIR